MEGKPKRRARGRIDYLLRIRVDISTQPIVVALLEAKKNTEPPDSLILSLLPMIAGNVA